MLNQFKDKGHALCIDSYIYGNDIPDAYSDRIDLFNNPSKCQFVTIKGDCMHVYMLM